MEISQLGLNIKRFRESKGWNIKQLKEESGVGYATLHDIESGKSQNLNSQNIEKLAAVLNVSADDLLGIDTIEYQVGDLEKTIEAVLESDELTIDDIVLTSVEKEEINDIIKFTINNIRKRRSSCKK